MTFSQLQETLGFSFKDTSLLKQAFIHRSYLNEDREVKVSNERLEFLGDAVLSFLTSRYLYQQYPEFPEGILTNIRSSLVKTSTLAQIATTLHLGELLFLSRGEEASGGRTNQSLLADVYESLLGAILLDQGIEACNTFLSTYLFSLTSDIIEKKSYIDFKSYLQELVQQDARISPTYVVTKSEGPDHARTFWVEVRVGASTLANGSGKSKQEAEQSAASAALAQMGKI